jgi:hypothetical protein
MRPRDVGAWRDEAQIDPDAGGDERLQRDPLHRQVGSIAIEVVDRVGVRGDVVAEGHAFDPIAAEARFGVDAVRLHLVVGEVPPERHLGVPRIDGDLRADLAREVEDVRTAAQQLLDDVRFVLLPAGHWRLLGALPPWPGLAGTTAPLATLLRLRELLRAVGRPLTLAEPKGFM